MTRPAAPLLALFLVAPPSTLANEAPTERPSLRALALTEPIDVDGDLSDAAWSGAGRGAAFVQREPRDGEPSS